VGSYLWNSGCDLAQGFFIGKPMKAKALKQWKAEWAKRYATFSVR